MPDERSTTYRLTQVEAPSPAAPPDVAEPSPIPQAPPPARRRLSRKWLYGLLGLGAIALVALSFRPAPIPVDLATIERGDLKVTVDAEGKTRIRDRFVIAAPVAGRLARIDLDEGDLVDRGDIVARIDPLPLDAKVRSARARLQELQAEIAGVATLRPKQEALARARADIDAAIAAQAEANANIARARSRADQANRDLQRAIDLETTGAISRQQREDAELTVATRDRELEAAQRGGDRASAEVAAAREALTLLEAERSDPDYLLDVYRAQIASVEAELANLADEASRTTLTAPSSGQVLRIQQESARFVEAGTVLLELGNSGEMELVVDVLSTDAVKIAPGNEIAIAHWGGEGLLAAKVRYIEPSAFTEVSALGVEEQRVNVIADLIDPPPSLGDGYRVEAQIATWSGEDVLKVPLSAMFRCDEGWCTFVNIEGRAEKREIAIAQRNPFEAVVTS
ncbi:MAG: HlyD family efflux transporter periplasmic adaptor subunit, partial [Cyanobacteria bacterium J06642_2]